MIKNAYQVVPQVVCPGKWSDVSPFTRRDAAAAEKLVEGHLG